MVEARLIDMRFSLAFEIPISSNRFVNPQDFLGLIALNSLSFPDAASVHRSSVHRRTIRV